MNWEEQFKLKLESIGLEGVKTLLASGDVPPGKIQFIEKCIHELEEKKKIQVEYLRLVSERFKDYRNSGIAFSVTVISISSALIWWGYQFLSDKKGAFPPQVMTSSCWRVFSLSLAVVFCLCIQFFNYQGYKCEARQAIGQEARNPTFWFDLEDFAVIMSVVMLGVGIAISCVTFFAI